MRTRHQPVPAPRNTLRGDRLLANADLKLSCCSECHHAHSDNVPATATAKVTQRCQICHKESAAVQ